MTADEMQYRNLVALNSKDELMKEIIIKIEKTLKNSQDLIYLTAESALKIMHNDFLVIYNQILDSKHTLMSEMVKDKENEI